MRNRGHSGKLRGMLADTGPQDAAARVLGLGQQLFPTRVRNEALPEAQRLVGTC